MVSLVPIGAVVCIGPGGKPEAVCGFGWPCGAIGAVPPCGVPWGGATGEYPPLPVIPLAPGRLERGTGTKL